MKLIHFLSIFGILIFIWAIIKKKKLHFLVQKRETGPEEHMCSSELGMYRPLNHVKNIRSQHHHLEKPPIVIQNIGRGSFSTVWKVNFGGEFMAMKVIKVPNYIEKEKIDREILIAKQLKHKNIISFKGLRFKTFEQLMEMKYTQCRNPSKKFLGEMWLFFEYEDSYDNLAIHIETHLRDCKKTQSDYGYCGAFGTQRLSLISEQIIDGLSYAHQCLIAHSDIKPENILYNGETIKIIDWGLAYIGKSSQDQITRISGSPIYFSPEMFKSDPLYNPFLSDSWQLGVTLFELAFGYLVFEGSSLVEQKQKVLCDPLKFPPNTPNVILPSFYGLLEKNPLQRTKIVDLKGKQILYV
jgi:serine/threonine protein kinase